ncbi:hypothetical protein [Aurantimonas endophytica]|uniref:Uncharacterized protein n=1 Tax=Aurantimonas endophytica TaxID=1522175 RepID=A0A7W6HEW9_9HYPH|nr:hypothetical protein [Aurantimonas endophytica]MBB4003732.1 hypothetical protein [Aurantimonas endophytica]MCO6404587.1 hypothetical protein [Aurantimonas endophytica]
MADNKSFFRRVFSFGTDTEAARTPAEGTTPRASDSEYGRPESPDPEVRPVAAASSVADDEAGAGEATGPGDDGGGITPLAEMAAADAKSDDHSDPAQKKTPIG